MVRHSLLPVQTTAPGAAFKPLFSGYFLVSHQTVPMFILPHKEKLIHENFFEFSFDGRTPDAELFKKLNSADQYYLVERYNWDDGEEVLHWIIDSPKCDKGTAAMIFWLAEPDFYLKRTEATIPDYEKETFRLVQKIILKFQRNEFKKSRFKYDPSDRLCHFPDNLEIPAELRQPTKGVYPISLSGIVRAILDWKRKRKIKKREKRKMARSQKIEKH